MLLVIRPWQFFQNCICRAWLMAYTAFVFALLKEPDELSSLPWCLWLRITVQVVVTSPLKTHTNNKQLHQIVNKSDLDLRGEGDRRRKQRLAVQIKNISKNPLSLLLYASLQMCQNGFCVNLLWKQSQRYCNDTKWFSPVLATETEHILTRTHNAVSNFSNIFWFFEGELNSTFILIVIKEVYHSACRYNKRWVKDKNIVCVSACARTHTHTRTYVWEVENSKYHSPPPLHEEVQDDLWLPP